MTTLLVRALVRKTRKEILHFTIIYRKLLTFKIARMLWEYLILIYWIANILDTYILDI